MAEPALAEGQAVAVEIEGRPVVICRSGQRIFAIDNLCSHSGSRLAEGRIAKGVLSCPLHGAKFDLATGACLSVQMGLADVVTHEVRVADGRIEVALSARPMTKPLT
jgi:3-phenylpropionate/trans-cinnamate dioxygenase ferredoxin subunit